MELAIAAVGTAASAAAAAPVTTAATLVGGYAAYQGAVAQNKAATANAKAVAEEANLTAAQGVEAEVKQRQKVAGLIGEQKAAYGASGVEVGGGTALDVITDTKKLGDADALTIRANTLTKVNALRSEEAAYNSSKTNPWLAAGKTVLTDLAMGGMFKGMGAGSSAAKKAAALKDASTRAMTTWQGMPSFQTVA